MPVLTQVPDGANAARDRLLTTLLPDPRQALPEVRAAEAARDAVRSARREPEHRAGELDAVADELVARGLSPAQVREILGLRADEDLPGH
ncbi:hypothetical protein ACQPWY_36070 [Pseudonocardia xinjiangensis]|uniref:hypothetical protein n=1 Tax=Pseudonocardia xinjiangensis TaxID=75289 RepID=UPI003D9399C4